MYTNDLCFDIYSTIDDFKLTLSMTTAFVECYKTLVECLFDYGQFVMNDNAQTEKLFSPFAKIFDKCELSNVDTATLKEFQPFGSDSFLANKNVIYWVGSTSYTTYYPECFPGNIARAIYLWEKSSSKAASPVVGDSDMSDSGFFTNLVKPHLHGLIMWGMQSLREFAESHEINHEDGTHHFN